MRYGILIVTSFLLIVGCSTKTSSIKDNANQSIEENVNQLRDELTILSESIRVNLESDNETINISFEDNMLFEFGKYSIKSEFKNTLKILSDFLIKHPSFEISIEGYTDSVGDKHSNLILSENRALAVATVLIENNVSSQRISSIGYGENNPKYDNNTEEGRSGNRRAEIKLKKYFDDNNRDSAIVPESEIVIAEDTDTPPVEIIEESGYSQEQNIEADSLAKEKRKIKKAKQRAKRKKEEARKAKQRAKHKKEEARKAKQRAKRKKEEARKAKQRAKHKKEEAKRAKEQKAKQEQIRREKEERAKQERIKEAEEEKAKPSSSII